MSFYQPACISLLYLCVCLVIFVYVAVCEKRLPEFCYICFRLLKYCFFFKFCFYKSIFSLLLSSIFSIVSILDEKKKIERMLFHFENVRNCMQNVCKKTISWIRFLKLQDCCIIKKQTNDQECTLFNKPTRCRQKISSSIRNNNNIDNSNKKKMN